MRLLLRWLMAAAMCGSSAGPVLAQPSAPPGARGAKVEASLPTTRAGAVERAAQLLETRFTYPEVGRRYAAMLRANLASGVYDAPGDAAATLCAKLTADIQAVASDRHLKVFPDDARPGVSSGANGQGGPPRKERARRRSPTRAG